VDIAIAGFGAEVSAAMAGMTPLSAAHTIKAHRISLALFTQLLVDLNAWNYPLSGLSIVSLATVVPAIAYVDTSNNLGAAEP
jgi:hypothetical protein